MKLIVFFSKFKFFLSFYVGVCWKLKFFFLFSTMICCNDKLDKKHSHTHTQQNYANYFIEMEINNLMHWFEKYEKFLMFCCCCCCCSDFVVMDDCIDSNTIELWWWWCFEKHEWTTFVWVCVKLFVNVHDDIYHLYLYCDLFFDYIMFPYIKIGKKIFSDKNSRHHQHQYSLFINVAIERFLLNWIFFLLFSQCLFCSFICVCGSYVIFFCILVFCSNCDSILSIHRYVFLIFFFCFFYYCSITYDPHHHQSQHNKTMNDLNVHQYPSLFRWIELQNKTLNIKKRRKSLSFIKHIVFIITKKKWTMETKTQCSRKKYASAITIQ